jgi:hypothetical protein
MAVQEWKMKKVVEYRGYRIVPGHMVPRYENFLGYAFIVYRPSGGVFCAVNDVRGAKRLIDEFAQGEPT